MREPSCKPGLIGKILNYLYPSDCPSCGKKTDSYYYAPFCRLCWSSIRQYVGPACHVCAAPVVSEGTINCSACLQKHPAFSEARCYGLYEGTLALAVNAYKFQGIRRLARPLGGLMASLGTDDADAVVAVPMSLKGLRERGFNQSLLLAKGIADEKGVPLIIGGLRKTRETCPQVGLSARERASNLKGAFTSTVDFKGKKVLLVDDVMTTGATVNECAKELKKAGAKDVTVLTIARASAL